MWSCWSDKVSVQMKNMSIKFESGNERTPFDMCERGAAKRKKIEWSECRESPSANTSLICFWCNSNKSQSNSRPIAKRRHYINRSTSCAHCIRSYGKRIFRLRTQLTCELYLHCNLLGHRVSTIRLIAFRFNSWYRNFYCPYLHLIRLVCVSL